jgi:hypothetical protein
MGHVPRWHLVYSSSRPPASLYSNDQLAFFFFEKKRSIRLASGNLQGRKGTKIISVRPSHVPPPRLEKMARCSPWAWRNGPGGWVGDTTPYKETRPHENCEAMVLELSMGVRSSRLRRPGLNSMSTQVYFFNKKQKWNAPTPSFRGRRLADPHLPQSFTHSPRHALHGKKNKEKLSRTVTGK